MMLAAEDQLLYFCSLRETRDLDQETLVRTTSQIKDWDDLLKKSASHRLQPRLYSFLKHHDAPSFLEPAAWKKVERAYLVAQAHTLALEGELTTVLLPRLNEAGIDVLLLKGAALVQTVYKTNPVRYFVDLDLLIHREDLAKTQEVLQEAGYRAWSVLPSRWHEEKSAFRTDQAHFDFVHPERGIWVDLHVETFEAWSLFDLDPNWLWQEARKISIADTYAFIPHPTRLFLHLLFHLVKHGIRRQKVLGWYLDLDECLRYFEGQIDGTFCRDLILKNPHFKEELEVLNFLLDHFSSPLPGELKQLLEGNKPKPLSLKNIFVAPPASELALWNHPDSSERFLFYWRRVAGVTEKAALLLRWVFPDVKFIETKYRARNAFQKLASYLRHFIVIGLKGASLGLYWLRRERAGSHSGGRI